MECDQRMADLDENKRCLNCKNGWTLNDKKENCECKDIVNKKNGWKCQTCQEMNNDQCTQCDKEGKCIKCDE